MSKALAHVESVSHWNAILRAAKEDHKPIIVDFFATWCAPCKAIAPVFEKLALQYPKAVFLKVDTDQLPAIAQKYKVTAMPTFVVIRESGVVDMMRGADPRGLSTMVAKHAAAPTGPPLSAEAEKAKTEGNTAFAAGNYEEAIDGYSRAISLAPESAILYGNRAFAYIKLVKSGIRPAEEEEEIRQKALSDAVQATTLDDKWAKGWVRMAEALMLATNEGSNEEQGRRGRLEEAVKVLEKAISFSEGKVKAEAQKMLEEARANLIGP